MKCHLEILILISFSSRRHDATAAAVFRCDKMSCPVGVYVPARAWTTALTANDAAHPTLLLRNLSYFLCVPPPGLLAGMVFEPRDGIAGP